MIFFVATNFLSVLFIFIPNVAFEYNYFFLLYAFYFFVYHRRWPNRIIKILEINLVRVTSKPEESLAFDKNHVEKEKKSDLDCEFRFAIGRMKGGCVDNVVHVSILFNVRRVRIRAFLLSCSSFNWCCC